MLHTLSIVWDVDPVWIRIGTFDIRYYGLMWALAILIAAKFFDNFVKREGLPAEVSESVFLYGTLATIIGARLGHCLFYDPVGYLSQPWTIITGFRDGGMASHGAAIGLLIGLWLFSRKNRLPYLWSLDRIMVGVTIGGAAVRFGNLLNSEIFGTATALPWGFEFVRSAKWLHEYAPAAVHPTQIYEAICYLATFAVMLWMYYGRDLGRRRPGMMFGVGLIGIFLTRFAIEFIKTEQESFEVDWALDMGQWLSIPFILLGGWMIWRVATRPAAAKGPAASTASAKPGTERGARPARKLRRRREPKQEAGRDAGPGNGHGSATGAGRQAKPGAGRSSEQKTRSLNAGAKAETKAESQTARRSKPKAETEPGKNGEPETARKPKGAPEPERNTENAPGSGRKPENPSDSRRKPEMERKPETEEASKPARRPRRRRGPKPETGAQPKPEAGQQTRPEAGQQLRPEAGQLRPEEANGAPKPNPTSQPETEQSPKQTPQPKETQPATGQQPKPARRPRRRRGPKPEAGAQPKPEAEQSAKQGAGVEPIPAQTPKSQQEQKPGPVQTPKPEQQPKPVQTPEPAQRPNPEQEQRPNPEQEPKA